MAHGSGFEMTPLRTLSRAARLWPAPARPTRDSATHNDVVTVKSTASEITTGPIPRPPVNEVIKGMPMKPVLGNAATKAPNEASFQPMDPFLVVTMLIATISTAQIR